MSKYTLSTGIYVRLDHVHLRLDIDFMMKFGPMSSRLVLVWIWNLVLLFKEAAAEETFTLHKRVEAAMILDEKHKSNARGRRRYAHAREFMNTLFQNHNLTVKIDPPSVEGVEQKYDPEKDENLYQFQAWPGTTTMNCPPPYEAPELRPGHVEGMDRGLLITHREIWDKFVRRRYKGKAANERQKVLEQNDVIVIFEDDVYPLEDKHQLAMLKEIDKMSTDLHFLGWFYYTEKEWSPLCMHAYVVTVAGARKLVDFTETCGPKPLDKQVQEMNQKPGYSTWSMTPPDAWDNGGICKMPRTHPYIDSHSLTEGISVPDILAYGGYGGLFTQVDFDANPSDSKEHSFSIRKMEGWVIKGKVSPAVYLIKGGTLHLIPDRDTFVKMGFDFGSVKTLSEWQVRQLPAGDPLPKKM